MEALQQLEIYIAAQKNVAFQFILIGVLLFILAAVFHFLGKGDLSAGLRTGSIVCGCFILIGGIAYQNTEHKLLETQKALYHESAEQFQQQEAARMEKVVKDYPVYQMVFGGFIMLSLLVVLFVSKPYWHGIAFSVIILFVLVMISEAFSHQSIKSYFEFLTQ
ncbi:MAG: hypothetical protein KI786_03975 [Mameliella sp.]|nr:hypothetical protein [Phaeodactylibacter sp.]NRA50894.1 hypothetical protein [Phaeodactylibacter sp.]